MTILLVDDEADLTELLAFALRRAGYSVVSAHDRTTALALVRSKQPDLAVLDVNLGPDSGFELLRDIRRFNRLPVIMLTARSDEADKVAGLGQGADDYVTKPFSHTELLARIAAQLRRYGYQRENEADSAAPVPPAVLEAGPLRLDHAQRSVQKSGHPLELTLTEYRLLRQFMGRPNVVLGREALLRDVWGYEDPAAADVLRVAIHRLRHKIEDDPAHPSLLVTVPGVGFILKS